MCQSSNYTFPDLSRVLTNSTYWNGNVSQYDWTVDKGNVMTTNSSELALLLTQTNGGTRVSSTRYVHYGTITITMKSGRWAGVVAAAITMSDIKDEIDWEFPGNITNAGQTNYFWQGFIPTKDNGGPVGNLTDTFENYHAYTIDWQPTALTFSIDGQVMRTIQQSSTIGSDGVARYPTTPSRVQLSIWPAGVPSEPLGVQQWAGGSINWEDPDYVSAGHFYTLIKSISVECSDPSAPPAGADGYIISTNTSANTPSVLFTNASVYLNGATALVGARVQYRAAVGVLAGLLVSSLFV